MRGNIKKIWLMLQCWLIYSVIFTQRFVLSKKIDNSQMNQIVTTFKQELESHIDRVLAHKQIQQMIENAEKNLFYAPINGGEIFNEVFQNVSVRYQDIILAANSLKNLLEKNISLLDFGSNTGPPTVNGGPSPTALTKCCCGSGPPGLFDGRLRDRVQQMACYGSKDRLLVSLNETGFESTLKNNYKSLEGITWQYFADSDGHYVQYPANNRACDTSAPPLPGSCNKVNSPLTKEWFVEKLYMEHKNLVILMDNSMEQLPSAPNVSHDVIVDAVSRILDTVTPSDKVNVVAFPASVHGAVEVPVRCDNKLFVATQANVNILKRNTELLSPAKGEPDLLEGLRKVYSLLETEKYENLESFSTRINLVVILLNGKSKPGNIQNTHVFEMIAKYQLKLDNSTQHFIYTLGKPDDKIFARLAQVADQNNLKLEKSSGVKVQPWSQIPNLVGNHSVGPEGVLVTTEDQSEFASAVARYFQRLPKQVDKELTTIVPVLDAKYGLGLTVAVPVYNGNQTFGVVAVDGSMATIFSEIVNFDTGVNSYMYMVDSTHGHVLLHPKLRDPAETRHKDTIFPRLELLEPDLTMEQRSQILTVGSRTPVTFEAQVTDIHPEIDGELVTSLVGSLSPATVHCKQIRGTRLVVVLVLFKSDVEEPKLHNLGQVQLHGIYHRLDKMFGSPGFPGHDSICHLDNGHFLSFKQSVVKFSPSVFVHPEFYKYSAESLNTITKLNQFVSKGTNTDLIHPALKDLVFHTLKATDDLDTLWTSNSREVIERFYGSVDGVFRLYPGTPLMNTYDHRETDWYKRSVVFPGTTMYHRGKLSVVNRRDVIIISRAVVSSIGEKRLHGVAGMTVTPKFLTSQLLNTVDDCYDEDYQCHIVDSSGNLLDSLTPDEDKHLSSLYPWISAKMVASGKLKQEWCTGFSDGFHKVTFTLTGDMTLNSTDPCQQFWLQKVKDTNLFVLVLGNRKELNCDDTSYKSCSSCQAGLYNPVYQLSIPQCDYCHVNETPSTCQCACYCDTSLDTCHGQFNTHLQNFPTTSCFYPPTYSTEFKPDSPGPMHNLERCPIPCVAIEDLDICNGLAHCKLSSSVYPTCIWKNDEELKKSNISRFFPTTTPVRPPMPSSTGAPKPPGSAPVGPMSKPATKPGLVSYQPRFTSKNTPGSPPHSVNSGPHIPTTAVGSMSTTTLKSPPSFVSTAKNSPVAPVMTGSPLHSVTGSSSSAVTDQTSKVTTEYKSTQTKQTEKSLGNNSDEEDRHLSSGAIAALVIGLLALVALIVFVVVKIYHKKFRTGADESFKYHARGSVFDSTVFLRGLDQVSINASAPSSTNIPYQEMGN